MVKRKCKLPQPQPARILVLRILVLGQEFSLFTYAAASGSPRATSSSFFLSVFGNKPNMMQWFCCAWCSCVVFENFNTLLLCKYCTLSSVCSKDFFFKRFFMASPCLQAGQKYVVNLLHNSLSRLPFFFVLFCSVWQHTAASSCRRRPLGSDPD